MGKRAKLKKLKSKNKVYAVEPEVTNKESLNRINYEIKHGRDLEAQKQASRKTAEDRYYEGGMYSFEDSAKQLLNLISRLSNKK